MDCRAIVIEIANYFAEGYNRERFSFFTRSSEHLKKRLRAVYFDRYRQSENDLVPRTGNFISAVYVEILRDILEEKDLKESISNGLVDRVFDNLREAGYGHLLDNEKT